MALQQRAKLSKQAALGLVLTLAKHGNHHLPVQMKTDGDVSRFFEANGLKLDQVVKDARTGEFVPHLENLIGATFQVSVGCGSSV